MFNIKHPDNVRVIEAGDEPGLLLECPLEARIHGQVMFEHLDAHGHIEGPMFPFIDHTVAPPSYDIRYNVLADLPPGRFPAGRKPFRHDVGEEYPEVRELARNPLKLPLRQAPELHVGLRLNMGAPGFTGEQCHLSDDVSFPAAGDGKDFSFLFHHDHAGPRLNDVERIPFLSLGYEAVSGAHLLQGDAVE